MGASNRLARLIPLAGVGFAVLTIAGYSTIGPFPGSLMAHAVRSPPPRTRARC